MGSHAAEALIARAIAAPARDDRTGATAAKVSKPTDRAELEAEDAARKVTRMRDAPAVQGGSKGVVQRAEAPASPAKVPASLAAPELSGGAPLPAAVRSHIEPRFGASFANVRIHTGDSAARQSAALNANAFTVGQHIFFGRDKFQPQTDSGQQLLAHELTHTIQQGAAVQRDVLHRSPLAPIRESVSPHVQRDFFGIPNPREYFAHRAEAIPGYTLLTVVLGFNPISGAAVERNAGNILRGVIQLIPGGTLITDALQAHGIFDRVSAWVAAKLAALKDVGNHLLQELRSLLDEALAHPTELFGLWDRGRAIVSDTIARVPAFAVGVKNDIVALIKEAILRPIAAFAKTTRGYPLLCAVMGKDPITGEPVPRDAESLLGAFLRFIGEEHVWEAIQKAHAIPRTLAWFRAAVEALHGFVNEIPGLFLQAWRALDVADIILIPRAFTKLAGVFGGFAGRFITWGASAVWTLLEIVFDVVSPGALVYVKKTGAALKSILKNPLPFVGNLVRAAKLGFQNFADHFLTHLKTGLLDWLTGALPGVYIPKAFSLGEIAKFTFSVLGLSWANIREKLVKATSETIVKALETGFDIVVTLVRDGPAAAWEKIKEQLANLKDMVIGGITDFVVDTVVKKAIPKLVSMFIPGAGFVSAILSIYDTIMVFVNKISQIVQVVTGFIDSIVAIAGGAIGAAATRVESVLAGLMSLAINFLAGFVGLGKVADKILAVIAKVRAPIDKALDALIAWIVKTAKSLFNKLFGKKDERTEEQKKADLAKAMADAEALKAKPGATEDSIKKGLPAIQKKYRLTTLELVVDSQGEATETVHIAGGMSPTSAGPKGQVKKKVSKPSKVEHKPGTVGPHAVGVEMTADWLDDSHPAGSPPQSGAQEGLMNLLVTDPSEGSTSKFIRGHLLNEHLGGPGTAVNLFPITANANSQHLHSTETTVKNWMKKPDRWVWYEVKVTNISAELGGGPKSPDNFVNATFECHAILKDADGKAEDNFSTTVPSVYGGKKQKATRIEHGPDEKT